MKYFLLMLTVVSLNVGAVTEKSADIYMPGEVGGNEVIGGTLDSNLPSIPKSSGRGKDLTYEEHMEEMNKPKKHGEDIDVIISRWWKNLTNNTEK